MRKRWFHLASLRAVWIADSIKFPEAECSFGIGTAIKIPDPSLSFRFASEIDNNRHNRKQELLTNFLLLKINITWANSFTCLLTEHILVGYRHDKAPKFLSKVKEDMFTQTKIKRKHAQNKYMHFNSLAI